jgi:NitT/TauT family transport system substrate-binding protein
MTTSAHCRAGARISVIAAVLTLCSALLAGCGDSGTGKLTNLTVGVGGTIFDAPMRVAEAKGFFRQEGLNVTFITLTASIYSIALQSNSVQFLNDSPTDFLTAVGRNFPEVAVSMDGAGSPLGLIVSTRFARQHGLTEQSPPGVVAKALVGSSGGASSATTKGQAGIFMREYGVNPESVHYVTLPSPSSDQAALRNNEIDWFITSEPVPLEAQDSGAGIVVAGPGAVSAWTIARSGYGQVVVIRKSFADQNAGLVRRFVDAVQEGSAYTRTHEVEAASIMKQTLPGAAQSTLLASLRLVDWPTTGAMNGSGWATSMAFISKEGAIPGGTKLSRSGWTDQYLP